MKKIFSVFLVALLNFTNAKGCLNYFFSVDNNGTLHATDDILTKFNTNFNKERIATRLPKLEARLKKERSYMLLSDYSVDLMKLGRHKEAIVILVEIYNHHPDLYQVAANLGTAYELNAQPDSAIKYIKRGLELNPGDHEGSEWIHVRILETKLALAKDPAYLQKHTVLRLTGEQKNNPTVREQLTIQVRERFPFTPAPDLFMANILVDLGDCHANTYSIVYAKALYNIARLYYGDKCAIVEKKINDMQKLNIKYASVQPKVTKNLEGTTSKLVGLTYKQCLDDNDENHYGVNWTKINTNVKSLISYVDFKKPGK